MIIASILGAKGHEVVTVAPEDTDPLRRPHPHPAPHRRRAGLDPSGRILGIVSERDIVAGMAGHGPGTTRCRPSS